MSMTNRLEIEDKAEVSHLDDALANEKGNHNRDVKHGDRALALIGDERIELTEEDNKRILRKTDRHILVILVWVYFLQILDKTIFGQGKVLGMTTATHLVGTEYSVASSMNAIAQLAWQPFSSYLLVRVPARYLMTAMVFGWGVAQCCIAASTNFAGLTASRFFLGLFEAGCLPLFSILTAQWYRRSEQPIRVAAWYGTNGIATIIASIIAYGFSHVTHSSIQPWQLIFILTGIITVLSCPVIYYVVDSDVSTARFFNEDERAMAIERLRANQTGTGTNEFKWGHVLEVALDVKCYLFLIMTLLVNVGAAVTTYFGPTLIANFGFSTQVTILLNMPFGAIQFICILGGCYAATKAKLKSAIVAAFIIPVIVGLTLLYVEGNVVTFQQGPALAGYYLLAFLFGTNPIIVSWMVANTAGTTKKALIMSVFNAGSAAGNIIGPLLFDDKDKPHYAPGVKAVLGLFSALFVTVIIQVVVLYFYNKQRERQRVAHGKPAKIKDTSMDHRYVAYGQEGDNLGQNALLDMTDIKNDEFTYVY